MAVTPSLFSLNGLATELSRDSRTLARILAGVKADDLSTGKPRWKLTTALRAIHAHEGHSNGRAGDGEFERVLDDLERLGAQYEAELIKLEAIKDVGARRARAKKVCGPLFSQIAEKLDENAATMDDNLAALTAPFRRELLAGGFGRLLAACELELKAD